MPFRLLFWGRESTMGDDLGMVFMGFSVVLFFLSAFVLLTRRSRRKASNRQLGFVLVAVLSFFIVGLLQIPFLLKGIWGFGVSVYGLVTSFKILFEAPYSALDKPQR
jgi:uncharacterized membrane protein